MPKSFEYMKSSAWWSITNDLCNLIVSKKKWIKKNFKYTWIADEIVVPTILYHSEFYKNVYNPSSQFMNRYIARVGPVTFMEWKPKSSGPETLSIEHLNQINESTCLFARKFNDNTFESFYNLIKK